MFCVAYGTSKQKLAYIFTQFLKIKPTEKNIDDMADMLGQSEILEPDAKKTPEQYEKETV